MMGSVGAPWLMVGWLEGGCAMLAVAVGGWRLLRLGLDWDMGGLCS